MSNCGCGFRRFGPFSAVDATRLCDSASVGDSTTVGDGASYINGNDNIVVIINGDININITGNKLGINVAENNTAAVTQANTIA